MRTCVLTYLRKNVCKELRICAYSALRHRKVAAARRRLPRTWPLKPSTEKQARLPSLIQTRRGALHHGGIHEKPLPPFSPLSLSRSLTSTLLNYAVKVS